MRVVINGWFLSRSDTGSGQYLDALIRHLPLQNTDLDLHIVTPYPSLPFPGLNLHYRAAGKSPLAKIRTNVGAYMEHYNTHAVGCIAI